MVPESSLSCAQEHWTLCRADLNQRISLHLTSVNLVLFFSPSAPYESPLWSGNACQVWAGHCYKLLKSGRHQPVQRNIAKEMRTNKYTSKTEDLNIIEFESVNWECGQWWSSWVHWSRITIARNMYSHPFKKINSWSTVLLQKVIIAHLTKTLSVFNWTRRFITVFTRANHCPCPEPDESSWQPPTPGLQSPF
jgi:hypothetical protein